MEVIIRICNGCKKRINKGDPYYTSKVEEYVPKMEKNKSAAYGWNGEKPILHFCPSCYNKLMTDE